MGSLVRARRAALPALAAAAAALLAGCTSSPVGERVTASPAATVAVDSPAPVPTLSTPPPTQQAADATPVSVRCGKLVPMSVVAQLEAGLEKDPGFVPAAGTPAAQEAALSGTACAWRNADGDLLEVSVAKPSREDAVALKNDMVRRSNSVPTYGGEAYFDVVDHVGRADAFRGRVWISARSNRFYEPGDAIGVIAAVDAALGLTKAATPAPTASVEATPTAGAAQPGSTPQPTP